MFCPQCGNQVIEGARFCPNCGAPMPAAAPQAPPPPSPAAPAPVAAAPPPPAAAPAPPPPPPPPPQPTYTAVAAPPAAAPSACPRCGAAVAAGRRFCTNCGYNLSGGAAATPRAGAAPARAASPMQVAALAAFALAAVSTFLPWVTFAGQSADLWESDARFQIADWIGESEPFDAVVLLVLALAGAYFAAAALVSMAAPRLPFVASLCGALIAVVGVLNYLYIDDFTGGGLKIGFGVYICVAAGAGAAILAFLHEQAQRLGNV